MAFSSSSSSSTSSLSPPVGSPYMPRRVAENAVAGRGPPAPLMHGQDGIYLPPHRGEEPAARKGAIFKIMECHMEWIGDLMPMYQTTEEKEAYLNKIIQTILEWLEEIKNRVVTPGTALLTRLMLAGFHAYLCQFNEALEWINEAVDNLATLAAEESPAHMRAYAYLLKANFYKINRKMKLMEGTPMKVLEQETAQEIKEIESLFDENGRSFHALLHIAKGILASKMVHQELQIESFRMAIELEPTCSHWHRLLYQALRKKRRETVRRPPTYEEKDAIRKAYDLDPDFCLNQTYYASMLEEKMKGAKDRELILEGNKQEIGDEIIHLMESALEKNPEDRWTTVRLAEIYAYGKFPHLDSKDGERMFEDCEERWPDCSMVLHKFGLYFAMTANNPQKALEYYTRSLESDSGNFPCLMDYLKTSHRVGRDKKQMLEMIDRCLGPVCLHNIGPQVRMLIAKGILLWSIDSNNGGEGARKQEACQAWIEAVKKDIKSAGFVVSRITAGYWDILGEYSIDVVKLENMLNVFQSLASSARDLEQEKAIRGLRMELHNHELNDQRPFGLELRYRTTSGSSSSARSSVSNSSYATARTSFSRADSVINWRESSSQPPPLVGGSGVFATYQDPMELRFRGGFNPVALNLGLVTMSNGYPNVDNGRGGMPKKKATPTHDSKPCIADLDNDWRR